MLLKKLELTKIMLLRAIQLSLLSFIVLIVGCQTQQQQTCLQIQKQTLNLLNTLQLADYHIVINKKPVEGITSNLSALTWNQDTQTLFATLNKPPTIVELSTTGKLLRTIETKGIRDPEAIEYIGNNQFIIADERHHKLLKVTIDKQTTLIDGHSLPQIKVGEVQKFNKGLEGLAYNNESQTIYASNESDPITIYKITGFIENQAITVTELNRNWSLLIDDISGLHFYQPYQHLLVLSDESKLILEVAPDNQIVGCMPLIRNQHGLLSNIRQPEGITMDDKSNLYIVSEPNLFYKFSKK